MRTALATAHAPPILGKTLSLEGLRGVAAMSVVFSHCVFSFYPFLQTGDPIDLRSRFEPMVLNGGGRVFYNGTFAVGVFFVMSGYVLTRRFMLDGDQRSLQEGASKRYFRLGPPVLASVLLCCSLMMAGLYPANVELRFLADAYRTPPSWLEALQDGLYRSLVFGNSTYNYVLWTIRSEFVGSLMLFAFLSLFGRLRWSGFIAVLAGAALLAVAPGADGVLYCLFLVGAYLHRLKMPRSPAGGFALALIGLYFGG